MSIKKDVMGSPKHYDPLIPSVNIEINMTICVDSGSVVLHSEDLM